MHLVIYLCDKYEMGSDDALNTLYTLDAPQLDALYEEILIQE